MVRTRPNEYALQFSEEDWEEICALCFDPFEFDSEEALTRGQWMAIGDMLLGKAYRIEAGNFADDGPGDDNPAWVAQLRRIADVIFGFFKPGDGKL